MVKNAQSQRLRWLWSTDQMRPPLFRRQPCAMQCIASIPLPLRRRVLRGCFQVLHRFRGLRFRQYETQPQAVFKLRLISAKPGLFPYININVLKIFAEKDSPTNIESPNSPILVTICHAGISDTPNLSII